VLRAVSRRVDFLPATGGAVEDLDHPEFEEREDRALNEEDQLFDTLFERAPSRQRLSPYRAVPPLDRSQRHLFRYFLDGSFHSYFLGTALEGERQSPVHYAQIGACVLHRQDDGTVRRERIALQHLLVVAKSRLSEEVWNSLGDLADAEGIRLVDLAEEDVVSRVLSDFDLRNKAGGKVRWKMHELEAELVRAMLPRLSSDTWLIVDGSLLFSPLTAILSQRGKLEPAVGVAKSFRKDPRFVFGRGPRAERATIFQLLAKLEAGHRTAAFASRGGLVVFWYVRLREQRHLDYPLMGVVKVELVNPSREPPSSELLDEISGALVAERSVTPHGRDRRWHAHLYPIFLAEESLRAAFFSSEVVRQCMRWR